MQVAVCRHGMLVVVGQHANRGEGGRVVGCGCAEGVVYPPNRFAVLRLDIGASRGLGLGAMVQPGFFQSHEQ